MMLTLWLKELKGVDIRGTHGDEELKRTVMSFVYIHIDDVCFEY